MKKPSKRRHPKCQKIFIAGTDTGVGKTFLTALLYLHLEKRGYKCRAVKPVSCGTRADARLLSTVQSRRFGLDEIDPFHFKIPTAPFIAAKKEGRKIQFKKVVDWVERVSVKQDYLLIEGCGGFQTPITQKKANWNLAKESDSKVILITKNRLGCLNQVIAFTRLAKFLSVPVSGVVLTGVSGVKSDQSRRTNGRVLRLLLPDIPICEMPYLSRISPSKMGFEAVEKKVKKMLAVFLEAGHCAPVFRS